jgi:predicted DsbA family dithiol-disulfide isomerase
VVKVEIWSDIVCPWCYIGKRRMESALEQFAHRDEVEVQFRSFELNLNAPIRDETDLEVGLARKYGLTIEQARALNDRVVATAAGEGLEYRLDIAKRANTFNAHRLLQLAAREGRQGAMKERLMAAYFTEGQSISEVESLVGLAKDAGLDPEQARAVLESDEFSDEVRADEREAAELGITGVPFFVINRRYAVSGAQPSELLLTALDRAWGELAQKT